MPQERRTVFLSSIFSFPLVNNYLTFSTFLFVSGFHYYYKIIQSFSNSLNVVDISNGTAFAEAELKSVNIAEKLISTILRHRLLLYILLNTCCATITFIGKVLVENLFNVLSSQEENLFKKTFRTFIQTKLMFLIFISHHNLFEDILIWMPWLAIHAVCTLLLELSSSRLSNPFNVVSNKSVRRRLYTVNAITAVSSFIMALFVICIRHHININYILFLEADCCLLFVQSIHLMSKLFTIVDSNSQRGQMSSTSSYYADLTYDLVHDSVEFVNYLHMIFFSKLAVTYCCVFLIVQAKHYYTRISTKIQKHWQHQEIIRHISVCYAKANDEDLLKNAQCTICWQTMKSARKLPCGHVFHELCLRRWLEQDSSCAICRQSLSLNLDHVLRGGELIGEDVDNVLQYVVEVFSPHNNRLARWWTRLLFESMNNDQVNAMVDRVSEMFPDRMREEVQNVVRDMGSITGAVDYFLASTGAANARETDNNEHAVNRMFNVSESDTDEVSNVLNALQNNGDVSNLENHASTSAATESASQPVLTIGEVNANSSKYSFSLQNSNPWFVQRAQEMIKISRRRYLQSSRANDICYLYKDSLPTL